MLPIAPPSSRKAGRIVKRAGIAKNSPCCEPMVAPDAELKNAQIISKGVLSIIIFLKFFLLMLEKLKKLIKMKKSSMINCNLKSILVIIFKDMKSNGRVNTSPANVIIGAVMLSGSHPFLYPAKTTLRVKKSIMKAENKPARYEIKINSRKLASKPILFDIIHEMKPRKKLIEKVRLKEEEILSLSKGFFFPGRISPVCK